MWDCEQLVICRDDALTLRAVIVIDDTTLGPGLGGVRMQRYPSLQAAIEEAQRLAAAMTLKNALAELPFGGAKSVILDPGSAVDRTALLRRFGEFVARTGGAYFPGVDMGTTVDDLATIGAEGADVACAEEDPSPWTALGVAAAITAVVERVDRRTGIDGIEIIVQGAGHVGAALARELTARGARVALADLDPRRSAAVAEALGARAIPAQAALTESCDVFAPCAGARVVTAEIVPRLRCKLIAGAANDTLENASVAERLARNGIVYVPDFVANAGGVIHIQALREDWADAVLRDNVWRIGDRVAALLDEAERLGAGATPQTVAVARARRLIAQARERRGARVPA